MQTILKKPQDTKIFPFIYCKCDKFTSNKFSVKSFSISLLIKYNSIKYSDLIII